MVKVVNRTQKSIREEERKEAIRGLVKKICGDTTGSGPLIIGINKKRGRIMAVNFPVNRVYVYDREYGDSARKFAEKYEEFLRVWESDKEIEVVLEEDYSGL